MTSESSCRYCRQPRDCFDELVKRYPCPAFFVWRPRELRCKPQHNAGELAQNLHLEEVWKLKKKKKTLNGNVVKQPSNFFFSVYAPPFLPEFEFTPVQRATIFLRGITADFISGLAAGGTAVCTVANDGFREILF